MAVGDGIDVCDGSGAEYSCRLSRIRDEECVAEIIESRISSRELPLDVTLYMAMPKGDKLEVVVQKAVELGASSIVAFESARCIKRPAPDKAAKLVERLSRIAYEAAKQCGRAKIPEVRGIISFRELLSELPGYELSLFCYEAEDEFSIKNVLKSHARPKSCAVIVGSEGGFSEEEAKLATEAGAVTVSLGKRILRCETAPDYALTAISYEYEM
jgi:16S rRNA (uracil1498-N3)-methyltransferase